MFCANCGEKIDDGAKFCIKCGTAVNSALPQTAPITPAPQAVPVQQIITGTNKLLLTADIIAIGLCGSFVFLVIILGKGSSGFLNEVLQDLCLWGNILGFDDLGPPLFFSLFIISTTLSSLGWNWKEIDGNWKKHNWKKSNKKMVLITGILYIVSSYGIPSGIMCIIAYRKMKKR